MKHALITTLCVIAAIIATAQTPTLIVTMKDGSTIRLITDNISHITFTDVDEEEIYVDDDFDVDVDNIHTVKAPLYYSVYEKCFLMEQQGIPGADRKITDDEWDQIIDFVAENLKPYGYNMICTDGFLPRNCRDSGYMTHLADTDLAKLSAKCQARGLTLGVYDNPLWINGDLSTQIPGTEATFADLLYDESRPESPEVNYPNATDRYHWIIPQYEGAREYIDGFFRHYKQMGVKFIRMDFLCHFEDGVEYSNPADDTAFAIKGKGYGRESYELALRYIAESAHKYGIFTSLVMPSLHNDAEFEAKYGHMFRVSADTYNGGWGQLAQNGGSNIFLDRFPSSKNLFVGQVYWSKLTGRDKVIADGDFIRANTYASDDELIFAITLQLMAGSPVAMTDRPEAIGSRLKYFQNRQVLALNADGFVGHPVSNEYANNKSETWVGQMSNGDYIVAAFNRWWSSEGNTRDFLIPFSSVGINAEKMHCRELWTGTDMGTISGNISASIPYHSARIYRLSPIL